MRTKLALVTAIAAALLGIGAGTASAHHYDGLLAPTSTCPNQLNTGASVAAQEHSMRCMHNYVRARKRLPRLTTRSSIDSSSGYKASDILRCQHFSHRACG